MSEGDEEKEIINEQLEEKNEEIKEVKIEEKKEEEKNEKEKNNNIKDFYRCPECNQIPFIKYDKENYTISTECNNNHIFKNIPLAQFISDLNKNISEKNNEQEKNKLNDSLCSIHQEKFINYCNTCKNNLCMYCDYTKHESHDIKIFFPLISNLESNLKETKLKFEYLNEFIDKIEEWRVKMNEKILEFEKIIKNNILLINLNTMNIDLKNINYQILQNFFEFSDYKNENIHYFKEFLSAKNFIRKGKILMNILKLYEIKNNKIEKKEEMKKDLINNIEVKSTMNQSAYPFNYFSLKDENFENNLIGLISDENIKIYSVSKNNLDFEMQEKLVINESKNINYLTTLELKSNKNKNNIIICVENFFKIIKILIEENSIIGYEEKKIFNLNNTIKKIILNQNKIIACDTNTISIYDKNIDNIENNKEEDIYNFKKINEIKAEEGNNIYNIVNINENEIASIQKKEKVDNKILIHFYSLNDYKSIKNLDININNIYLKNNENLTISCYSCIMINKEILGLVSMNYLFLINVNNKELINTITFKDELYFIEKYINDSFIINRKIINKEKDNKEQKKSILYQYKIGKDYEIVEMGQNNEMPNISEFKYFDEYKLAISTSFDNNIVSIWN